MHYGVPGMRWGHRKPQSYVSAKNKRKQAYKEYRKSTRWGRDFGVEGIKRANKAEKKYIDADVKFASERVKYKASKAKNKEKKEKKELNAYVNEFTRAGLPGSHDDRQSGGRSTALYNKVAKDKGKKYADRVLKKTQNQLVATIATSAVVTLGLAVTQSILENR